MGFAGDHFKVLPAATEPHGLRYLAATYWTKRSWSVWFRG